MPVKMKWIVLIMGAAVLFTIGAIYLVQEYQLEQDEGAYSYGEKLFKKEDVSTIEINIDDDQWEDLLANPLDEEYKEASITINGEKVSNVAVRTKGNSSLTSVARDDSERYSLKIDFNYYDSTQSFYGLKKLNLNNNFSDSTQMKEYVSYELMEQIGVATPAHSYMKVLVNGEYYGLMLGVEAIDEAFIARHYQTTQGYLYKPDGTGSDLVYIGDSINDYEGIEVKMNEESVEDSELIPMLKAINEEEGYEEYLNTDQLLRYFAMNTALVSLDSYQGQLKHNYYLYEDENGEFSILPWDYNMAFGGFNMGGGGPEMGGNGFDPDDSGAPPDFSPQGQDGNQPQWPSAPGDGGQGQGNGTGRGPDQGGMMMPSGDLMSENTINFSISEPVSGTSLAERPLLNVLLSDEQLHAQYESYMEQIATEILTEDNVAAITAELADLLEPYIESDPSKFFTTEEFFDGVSGDNSLPEFAKQRSESILAQLSGELVVESSGTAGMQGPNQDRGQPQDGAPPQMNGGMRGGFDINAMSDEEFAQLIERIQSGNSPFSLPEGFDSMTVEEQKATLAETMGGMGGPPGAGGNGDDRGFPMMNNEAKKDVSEEPTGDYTKTDVYLLLVFFALTAVAITVFRRIGR